LLLAATKTKKGKRFFFHPFLVVITVASVSVVITVAFVLACAW
jgi:hypothetical protein